MAKDSRGKKIDPTYLNSLPKMKFMIAGQPIIGRYDAEKHEVFMLDGNGNVIRHATGIILTEQEQRDALIHDGKPTPKPQEKVSAPVAQPEEPAPAEATVPASAPSQAAEEPSKETPVTSNQEEASDGNSNMVGPIVSAPASSTKEEDEPTPRKKKKKKEKKSEDDNGWSDELPEAPPQKKKSSKKIIAICSVALLLVGGGLLAAQVLDFSSFLGDGKTPPETLPPVGTNATTLATEPSTEATTPTETEPVETTEPAASDNTQPSEDSSVYVLKAKDVLLPGHKITVEDFEEVGMTQIEYQTLSAGGGFYTSMELDRLTGLVVINYVPAGKYLSYEDVSTYYAPSNPWSKVENNQIVITLPVSPTDTDLLSYLWGNYVDVTIKVETKLQSESGKEDQVTTPDGIQHESSTVESILIDTYKLRAVGIIDALDVNKFSLFSRYTALSSIPVVFRQDYLATQYTDNAEAITSDIPVYIQIAVPVEQSELLLSLDQKNMTVTVGAATQNNTTDIQTSTYTSLQETGTIIANLWKGLSEEGEQ